MCTFSSIGIRTVFELYSSYCPFWVHGSSQMEVSASVTISFPLSHKKRKTIYVMEDVMCHPGAHPFRNEDLITLDIGTAVGRQLLFVGTFQGCLSWVISLTQGHTTFLRHWRSRTDGCRSTKGWLSHSGQLWVIMSSTGFAGVSTETARLPLQLDFSLCLISLAPFPSVGAVPKCHP